MWCKGHSSFVIGKQAKDFQQIQPPVIQSITCMEALLEILWWATACRDADACCAPGFSPMQVRDLRALELLAPGEPAQIFSLPGAMH